MKSVPLRWEGLGQHGNQGMSRRKWVGQGRWASISSPDPGSTGC